jgi:hypothetical protein
MVTMDMFRNEKCGHSRWTKNIPERETGDLMPWSSRSDRCVGSRLVEELNWGIMARWR